MATTGLAWNARNRPSAPGTPPTSSPWWTRPYRVVALTRTSRHEAYLPAEQQTSEAQTRIPRPDADARWAEHHPAAQEQGPQASVCVEADPRVGGSPMPTPTKLRGRQGGPSMGASRLAERRLRSSRDVQEVLASGARLHGQAVVVHALRRSDATREAGRMAVVAGRKVGNAVERNRAKRRLRAALAHTALPGDVDAVVVARRRALSIPFPALRVELTQLLERAARRERQSC